MNPVTEHRCSCCKSLVFLCLFLSVLLRTSLSAHSYVLHHKHSAVGDRWAHKSIHSDLAELNLPPSWLTNLHDASAKDSNLDHHQSSHLLSASSDLPNTDEETDDQEFNHNEGLADIEVGKDNVGDDSIAKTTNTLLTLDAVVAAATNRTANTDTSAKVAELDRLIGEIAAEGDQERVANQVDNTFQQAEAIKAKLDFEINRTRLVLMRLRSLQRNVQSAHLLAKKLVESEVVSQYIKDFAVTNLDKSVEKVKKVLVTVGSS